MIRCTTEQFRKEHTEFYMRLVALYYTTTIYNERCCLLSLPGDGDERISY